MRHLNRIELDGDPVPNGVLEEFRLTMPARGPERTCGEGLDQSAPVVAACLKDPREIRDLAGEWQALEAVCAGATFFQTWAWCHNYIEFAQSGRETAHHETAFDPRVFVLRQGMKLIGLLPLSIQRNRGLQVLTGLTEPFQQYTDMLLHPDTDLAQAKAALLEALRCSGADYLHFGQVRADSMLAMVFGEAIPARGEVDAAPFVHLSRYRDHDSYLSNVRSKTRKNLRNARNRLERDAPVTHHVARGGALMEAVIERAFSGREAWLESLGITSRAFQHSDFKGFLDRFASGGAEGIETIAMSLKHGDKTLSDQWGFVSNGRYYAFMANWNPEFEAFSPGRLHLGEVIRSCFEEGFDTVDFLIPASSYKLTWTEDSVPVQDRILPLTRRGWLFATLWLEILRPRAKQVFFRLPQGLRQILIRRA